MLDKANLLDIVANAIGKDKELILRKDRSRLMVTARHIYFYFARNYLNMTLYEICEAMRLKDHSTVIHGLRKVNDMITIKDDHYTALIHDIDKIIKDDFRRDTKVTLFIPYNVNIKDLCNMLTSQYNCRAILTA
jgi:chromosomal replication initiation ATPase DnaA